MSAGDVRRASDVFDDYIGQTFNIDLRDLSRDRWSLVPDARATSIAEVRTRRLGSLTYARSTKDAEDISLFERRRRRNIAVYASRQKLSTRGRFYGEDELVEYDVLRHELDVAFSPDRLWIDGRVDDQGQDPSVALSSMTLRLAEALTVRDVSSEPGPAAVPAGHRAEQRDRELSDLAAPQRRDLASARLRRPARAAADRSRRHRPRPAGERPAGGRLHPGRAAVHLQQPELLVSAEHRSPTTRPAASHHGPGGIRRRRERHRDRAAGAGTGRGRPGQRARKQYVFEADRPMRYLACVISRFTRVASRERLDPGGRDRRAATAADR